ncbi:hypothetical protein EON63_17920 [archaeon]|nr:MAG: hypothetical protein EON63_17920 [archaeon]
MHAIYLCKCIRVYGVWCMGCLGDVGLLLVQILLLPFLLILPLQIPQHGDEGSGLHNGVRPSPL